MAEEMKEEQKCLIEAALFMSQNALSIADLVAATGIASPGFIAKAVKELSDEYNTRNTSLQIMNIDGKYMLTLREPYAGRMSKLAAGPDISRPSLRVLAYISKNEGIMQSNIVKVFGSSAYLYLKELYEKEFVEGKKKGRSKVLHTTQKFKEYFAIQ